MEPLFTVGTAGIDVEKLVADIRAEVARKKELGAYTDARIARAERMNLQHLRNEENFLAFYLDCMRDGVFVDISDYEIHERRRWFARPLLALKRLIWNVLKFYTYRLWSQQNQANGMLLGAIEEMENRYTERIRALEKRVADLEPRR